MTAMASTNIICLFAWKTLVCPMVSAQQNVPMIMAKGLVNDIHEWMLMPDDEHDYGH